MSTQVTPLATYRASTSALDHRGWNLALCFQEVFTAIVRVRYNRQAVSSADSFRAQVKQALQQAEQEARSRGYTAEDVRQIIFALVAFLDESVLSSRNPIFADWPRLPLQTELFGQQIAGEIVFREVQKVLTRADSHEVADLLEVYYLCLLLGFKGRYAAGGAGDLHSIMGTIKEKIRRARGASAVLSPRGLLPSDAVRVAESDPWVRKLAVAAVVILVLAVVAFVICKVTLVSGASDLARLSTVVIRGGLNGWV
ncbi:MAG TPA: DotU family type IV/VI secretion system protein [Terriglobales bacterium]